MLHQFILPCIPSGATGTGKTYLACTLGDAACRNGLTVQYSQSVKLLRELKAAHIDGTYEKLLAKLGKIRILILDDWILDSLNLEQTRDILEIVDDRFDRASTMFSTQLPVSEWHFRFEDPTLADAIIPDYALQMPEDLSRIELHLLGEGTTGKNAC